MGRPPRADEGGGIYHALNRGNSRQNIFFKDGRPADVYNYASQNSYRCDSFAYYENRLFQTKTIHSQMINGVAAVGEVVEYRGYSAQSQLVRTVKTRAPITYTNNSSLLNLVRPTGINPQIQIVDGIRDLRGELIETIGPDGTISRNEYDPQGRQIKQYQAFGTTDQLLSQTEYNPTGNVFASIGTDGLRTERLYDPADNVIESKVLGGTAGNQTTKYTYNLKGQPKQTIANDGSINEQFYSACCARLQGTRNALGNGQIVNTNSAGEVVHSVTVADFDTQINNSLNPATASSFGETTTRYRDDGRIVFTTHWSSDPGPINVENPPIAGIDSVPATNGVTTQYVYDNYLNDGDGLNSSGGKTIQRLHSGGVSAINILAALTKLSQVQSSGGAEVTFVADYDGSATVVISPDENTMSVSITDGAGQSVMSAVMSGPAATTPNQLIDWSCSRSMIPYSLAGYATVVSNRQIAADGTATTTLVNGLGETVGQLDQAGNLTRDTYNVAGYMTKTADPLNRQTNFTYDRLGRRLTTTDANNKTVVLTYDTGGRVKTVKDAKNQTMTNTYDPLGRLIEVNDRTGKVTTRAYDNMNRLVALIDAENRGTAYDYDAIGQRTNVTLDDGSETDYSYDAAGRVAEVTLPSNIKRTSLFEYSGVVDKVEYRNPAGTLTGTDDFTYDDFLKPISSTSRDGVIRALGYTERGQLGSDTTTYGGQAYVVGYDYDDRGRLKKITYPSGRNAEYTFENRGMLDLIKWDGTQVEDRAYNSVGLLAGVDRQAVDETRVYDVLNRVTSIGNTNVGTGTYTYDANSNKLSESWSGAMAVWNFVTTNAGANPQGYDAEDRFVHFAQSGQAKTFNFTRSNIGNINNVNLNGTNTARGYSNIHALTSVGSTPQVFDVDGNLTNAMSGIDFAWDEAGMMKESIVGTGDTAGITGTNTYGYDSDRKRVWKKRVLSGTTTEHTVYIHAGPNVIAEYPAGTAAASPTQEYVYGQEIDSLMMLVRSGGSEKLTVTRNQQWSVSALSNSTSGAVLERYTYDAFGKRTILAADGATVRATSSYNMPYGYTSRRHDDESGLMYFRARFYDPETGEFCSKDPLEYVDGMSLYRAYFVPGGVDPRGTMVRLTDYVQEKYCKRRMLARRKQISELTGRLNGQRRSNIGNCDRCKDCDTVTILIELPHSCQKGDFVVGHTGIGIGDDYFDYGPRTPVTGAFDDVEAGPWWDNPKHHPGGKQSPWDVGLEDVIKYAKGMELDIFKIQLCVKKDLADDIRKWWEDRYNQGAKNRYCVPGSHCTSTVIWSIEESQGIPGTSGYGALSPSGFLDLLCQKAKHSCGSNSGKPAFIKQIEKEIDPYK